MTTYRISYVNQIDGERRVFIGGIDKNTAEAVMAKWADPTNTNFYMGDGMRVEPCDGTPDGQRVSTKAEAA